MSMSRKDFILVALAIKRHNQGSGTAFTVGQIETLADAFAEVNPRFNRKKWIDYLTYDLEESSAR